MNRFRQLLHRRGSYHEPSGSIKVIASYRIAGCPIRNLSQLTRCDLLSEC